MPPKGSRGSLFTIGDLASLKDEQGKPLPGVAPVAIQQGRFVAKLIRREIEANGDPQHTRSAFHYWDKGSLATIGLNTKAIQGQPLRTLRVPKDQANMCSLLSSKLSFCHRRECASQTLRRSD